MSLNGLDNAKVKEAYDAAIAELGGWWVTDSSTLWNTIDFCQLIGFSSNTYHETKSISSNGEMEGLWKSGMR